MLTCRQAPAVSSEGQPRNRIPVTLEGVQVQAVVVVVMGVGGVTLNPKGRRERWLKWPSRGRCFAREEERVSDLRSANEVMICCTVEVRDVTLGMRQEIV